jgi:hypothetical protein
MNIPDFEVIYVPYNAEASILQTQSSQPITSVTYDNLADQASITATNVGFIIPPFNLSEKDSLSTIAESKILNMLNDVNDMITEVNTIQIKIKEPMLI